MMNRNPVKPCRAKLPALLVAACLCVLQGASGCGKSGACGAFAENASGAAPPAAAGSACQLPCVDDADCGELGGDAVCNDAQCERPARSSLGSSSAALCDGSEDVRFASTVGGGIGTSEYYRFAASYGSAFLAIDGQCRFWRSTAAGGTAQRSRP